MTDDPVPEPREMTHVRIPLDGLDDPMPRSECVWAEPLGDDRYRIANVPFFARDVGLHDVVVAADAGGHLELVDVVDRRCVASFNYELAAAVDRRVFFAEVRGTGASTECLAGRCYTSALHHAHSADAFEGLLRPSCRWFERFDARGRLVAEWGDVAG